MGERKFVGEESEEELGMARAAPLCGCVWGEGLLYSTQRIVPNSPLHWALQQFLWREACRRNWYWGSQGPLSQGWIPAVNIPAVPTTSLENIPRQNVLCPPVPACFQQPSSWHLLQVLESSWQFLFIRDPSSCPHQFYPRVTQLTGEHRRRGPGSYFSFCKSS